MSELYYAEMEAARNAAEDAYFKARPGIPDEPTPQWSPRRLFCAGFERGFKHQWDQRHADSADAPLTAQERQNLDDVTASMEREPWSVGSASESRHE